MNKRIESCYIVGEEELRLIIVTVSVARARDEHETRSRTRNVRDSNAVS
jgi:hypothetical protein